MHPGGPGGGGGGRGRQGEAFLSSQVMTQMDLVSDMNCSLGDPN